jgi:hypothetical protein
VQLPAALQIPPPELPRFGQRVLLETACTIALRSGLPMYRRVLGLADPAGELAGLLPTLLRYYACVKVATGNLTHYAAQSERMMRELGAPVLVGCDPDSMGDCALTLAADASHLPKPPKMPVLCLRGFPGGMPCITAPEITPPAEIAAACPPGIAPHLFAGALYEYSGVEAMRFTATAMLCDYRRTGLTEAVDAILRALSAGV